MVDAGRHRGRLAAVAPELEHAQLLVVGRELFRDSERIVLAAVVYKDDFVAVERPRDRSRYGFVERSNAVFFVV